MTSPELRSILRARLTHAMRDRDRAAVSAIRSAIARIENAEAVPVSPRDGSAASEHLAASEHVAGAALGVGVAEAQRRVLGAEEERGLVRAEIDELLEAADHYEQAAQAERAAEARAVADILSAVLVDATGAGR